MMLEIRKYNYEELVQIYKTDRIDKIKLHIKNDGYTMMRPEGRGKNIVITITCLPRGKDKFKVYCRDVLKFPANKHYDKLYAFMKRFLLDDDFKNLQFIQMKSELEKDGVKICPETISDYFHHLQKIGMIQFIYGDFVYEALNKERTETIRITRDEYKDFYKNYYQILRKLGEPFAEAFRKSMYGSMPKKRLMPLKNYMYKKYYDTLISCFMEEGEENG